ncbi:hypothetical protein ACWHLZ_30815 [Streptomyces chartreusis]
MASAPAKTETSKGDSSEKPAGRHPGRNTTFDDAGPKAAGLRG